MTSSSRQRALDRWSNCRATKRRKELQRRAAVKAKPAITITINGQEVPATIVKGVFPHRGREPKAWPRCAVTGFRR